jgi:hypothetical protein
VPDGTRKFLYFTQRFTRWANEGHVHAPLVGFGKDARGQAARSGKIGDDESAHADYDF